MLTDESIMLSGKHKGKKLANIPAHYLIWVYENNACSPAIREYIEYNLEVLKEEVARSNALKNKNLNR